ncbi:MAG: SLC13 family permease [Lachnospiraceae bacterium]
MKKVKDILLQFITKETVVFISMILAILSAIIIHPDKEYIDYIDYRTLSILLCLMLVMAGLQELGIFKKIGIFLLEKTSSIKSLAFVLVLLCFFLSMIITNDVALITFVPFTIEILVMAGLEQYLIPIIVLQTIGANLGSMLTPIGNPHNLYLYAQSNMHFFEFLQLMLPYSLVSLLSIVVAILILTGKQPTQALVKDETIIDQRAKMKIALYLLLFLLSLATISHVIPYGITLAITLLLVLIFDKSTIKKPDYYLLLTFTFLFIFMGNISRIPSIHHWLSDMVEKNELFTSILASQFTSNVPAAILLSGFTDNIRALLVGTNLGGLGTLIASMANLISYKILAKEYPEKRLSYIGYFTILNIVVLGILLLWNHFFSTI